MCNKIRDFMKVFFWLCPIIIGLAFYIYTMDTDMLLAAWSATQLFCIFLIAIVYIALDDFC